MKITLPHNFTPRQYQIPFFEAMETGVKRAVCVWHRRCLVGETQIAMSDGSFKSIKDIVIGDKVVSFGGKFLFPARVTEVYQNGISSVFDYNDLSCTSDHRILNERLSGWVEVDRARSLVNAGTLFFGKESDPKLAEILGLLLTDGYIKKNQTPKFTNIDPDLLERFERLIGSRFPDIVCRRYRKGKGFDILCPTKKKTSFHPLRKFFPTSNTFPSVVWSFDKESSLAFLSGVISGDGCISYKTTMTPRGFAAKTGALVIEAGISEELANDYKLFLLKFGIRAKIKKDPRGRNWRVFVYSLKSLHNLLGIKIYSEKKQKKLDDVLLSVSLQKPFNLEKKHTGLSHRAETYDITVEDGQSYIANGYIVHNSGKDKSFLNYLIPKMIERKGSYYYYFPTASMGRDILWDGMDREGFKFMDHFPKNLIKKKNESEMKIELINGSIFKIRGTDKNEPIGVNPVGCVFSEYSRQNPKGGWDLVRPILAENQGWAVFNFTPRGKNHAHRLYRMALDNPNWYCQRLTVDDTHAIPLEAIEEDRASGMSEEMIQQEYYTDFNIGQEGSYYGRTIQNMFTEERIGKVPWEPTAKVYTFWDLGIGDSTSIWFAQFIRKEIRIIDYYEFHGESILHYINYLRLKPYVYEKHYGPHDLKQRALQTGTTLLDTANQLGFAFEVLPQAKIEDGIEAVRSILPLCWIDSKKCSQGIDCLENYHREFNDKFEVYSEKPCHDWSSHGADSFRYLAMAYRYHLMINDEMIGYPGALRTYEETEIDDYDPIESIRA